MSKKRRKKNSSGMMIGAIVAATLIVALVIVFIVVMVGKEKKPDVIYEGETTTAYVGVKPQESTIGITTEAATTADVETTQESTDIPIDKTEDTTEEQTTPPVNLRTPADISIVAVGDNLIHNQIFESILRPDGVYDFSNVYDAGVINTLSSADLTIINQETPSFGNQHGVSTYPCFNAPTESIDSIINVLGADVLTLATNHSMDKEDAGLLGTLDYIHSHYPNVLTSGTFASYEASVTTPIVEVQGIKIAILNYTYGLNGNAPRESYEINLLTDLPKIEADMARAREEADFIIVYPHWGQEYHLEASDQQLMYAQYFADIGADLIIGAHPHVVQPFSMITAADGRQVPCYYSLGNFFSAQNLSPRTLGGVAKINLHMDEYGNVTISGIDYDFVVTYFTVNPLDWSFNDFKIYMLRDFPAQLEASSGIKLWSEDFTIQQYVDIAKRFNPGWTY